jgi:hypothetical protein
MNYIELNRSFISIGKKEEPNLDIGSYWGKRVAGWLNWADILKYNRVVLLAEASSGKSAEFLSQSDKLKASGHASFYIRIEELADQGFEAALDADDAKAFSQWRNGSGEAYYFLDSVDEARLNRKSFESALKRFGKELGESLTRTKIFISCRVSDWKGEVDTATISRLLPSRRPPVTPPTNIKKVDGLLNPIFGPKEDKDSSLSKKTFAHNPHELLLVQLVPLRTEQCEKLAQAAGVQNTVEFMKGVSLNRLDIFTERPGDLLDLVSYWNDNIKFGSFADMLEHSIQRKLIEQDPHRPDNTLSVKKALEGVERIAASLTLCKSFTVRAPEYDPDPSLASGALEPELILNDWNKADCAALLRRGIFTPSTYGRVRFHHRTTQEYLTAKWLERLISANCPKQEVWKLILTETYGVKTVVPSLRAIAAWLAIGHQDLCNEIIEREPLILIRYGDPQKLPLEAKQRLLIAYANKHTQGNVSDDHIEHKALWMFADAALADTIRKAWEINTRDDFQINLLRLIREGKITSCCDFAKSIMVKTGISDYLKITAIEALDACEDKKALEEAAKRLLANSTKISARLASRFAQVLFPKYINIEQLLSLIAKSEPGKKYSVEGFKYNITDLYDACPNALAKGKFVEGLSQLCLTPPFVADYDRISAKFKNLAERLEPIARHQMQTLGNGSPSSYLIQLLMVVERSVRSYSSHEDSSPSLREMVQKNLKIKQDLFWADVEETRTNAPNRQQLIRCWQVYIYHETLWQLNSDDIGWLSDDAVNRDHEDDRRVAFSAIMDIYNKIGSLTKEAPKLRELIKVEAILVTDLENYLQPKIESAEEKRLNLSIKRSSKERDKRVEKDKASWVNFKKIIEDNPECLRNRQKLEIGFLINLTEWLSHRTGADHEQACKEWRLLEEGFNRSVAEAYRDGMMIVWRITKPESPERKEGNGITVKWITILSFCGIGIEATENEEWAANLSSAEAKIAAMHGCLSEQGYPEWFDALVTCHADDVIPTLEQTILKDWSSTYTGGSYFLYRYGSASISIPLPVRQTLFQIIIGSEPKDISRLDRGLKIIKNLRLDKGQQRKLIQSSNRRLTKHIKSKNDDYAARYFALLLMFDAEKAVEKLDTWISKAKKTQQQNRANVLLRYYLIVMIPFMQVFLNALLSMF